MGIPPGIEPQRRQLAIGLNPLARRRPPQRHPQLRERILPQFHPLVVALAHDVDRHWLVLGGRVELRLGEGRVFAFLHSFLPPEPTLQPGVGGERQQLVVLRGIEPAIARLPVEPAGEFVAPVVECHREAVPAGIERGLFGVGRYRGRDGGGVALVECVTIQKRAGAIF